MSEMYVHAPRRCRGKSRQSGALIVLRDCIAFVVVLLIFALFHHALPMRLTPAGERRAAMAAEQPQSPQEQAQYLPTSASVPSQAEMPPQTETLPEPTLAPTPAPGDFSAGFPAEDTGVGALYSYQTDSVRIAINRIQTNGVTYFVADVYVKNIEAFRTAFANGTYGKGIHAFPTETAAANGAVFAVSGDYYSARSKGIVVRNGELYRDVVGQDSCVLFKTGEMKTFYGSEPDLTDFESQQIWQAWSFGPPLLAEDGGTLSNFDSQLSGKHPRCGIGYYAPGHYCFVVVDGRQQGYSVGISLAGFSQMFHDLGCLKAYNLDGGATAIMMFNGEVINQPYKGGRQSGDIIYFK